MPAGSTTTTDVTSSDVVVYHTTMNSCDDLLRKFWEIEETTSNDSPLMSEEKFVAQHFKENHYCRDKGAFVVPLPKRQRHEPLGESRSKAVRRLISCSDLCTLRVNSKSLALSWKSTLT